jgi:integrase
MASIEKRGENSWRLIVEVGYDANGKRIKRSKTVKGMGKREAEKVLARFQTEVEAGEYIAPEKMTFAAFTEEWRLKYALKELGAKTFDTYWHYLTKRIIPVFGNMRLDQVKTYHIVKFISELTDDGSRQDGKEGQLSQATARYILRVLTNVFARAVDWKIIKTSPTDSVKKPKMNKTEIKVYDEVEIAALFEALETEPIGWRVMIILTLTTGLRRGELVGLEWKHINLEKGTLEVRQTISSFNKGVPVITEPKTEKSNRTISLSNATISELREYKKHIHEQLDQVGDAWKGDGHFFVFSNYDGKPYYPSTPYLHFREFQKKHGLRYIRFHDLRHIAATLLISQGVHAKIISERLGHASIATTMNIYGHAMQTADKEAANQYDSILPFKNRKQNA